MPKKAAGADSERNPAAASRPRSLLSSYSFRGSSTLPAVEAVSTNLAQGVLLGRCSSSAERLPGERRMVSNRSTRLPLRLASVSSSHQPTSVTKPKTA